MLRVFALHELMTKQLFYRRHGFLILVFEALSISLKHINGARSVVLSRFCQAIEKQAGLTLNVTTSNHCEHE